MSGNYDKIRLLGEGAFGKAFLAKCKTSKNYIVLKEINLSKMPPKDKQEARREVMVLSSLEHCCIVKYLNSYETTTFLVIVMEFCDNGDLQHQLKSRLSFVPEDQVLNWFVQICLALKHLHDRKILHRDIKSQNVFLTKSGLVKLGDFGIAKMLNNTSELALTQAGTPYYLSPEICDAKPYNNKSDIWSMGCILYEMTTLKYPFSGKSVMDLVRNIKRSSYAPIPRCYRADMHELVSKLLKKNPSDRPDVNSLLRFPIIWRKIGDYLSKEDFEKEFSHTVLHGLKVSTPSAPIKWQRKINRHSKFCNDKGDKREGKMILKKNNDIQPGVDDLKIRQFCHAEKSKANIYNKIEMKKHQLVADNPKLPKGAPQKDVMKNNFLIRRNEYAEQLKRIRMQNLRKNLTPRGYKDKASNMMNKNRKNIPQRNKKCFDESRQRDLEEVRALGRIESAKSKKKATSKNPSGQKSGRNAAKFKCQSPVLQRRRNSGQPDIKNMNAMSDKVGRADKRKSLPNIKDRKQWNVPQSSMSKKKIINIECLEDGDETDKRMRGNKLKHSEVKELLMTGTLDVINPILLRTCSEPDFQNIEGLSSDDDDDDDFENKKASKKNSEGDMSLLKSKSMEDLSLIFHAKSIGELSSSSLESSCSESNDELNSVRESMVSCLTLTPRLNLKQDLENIQETNEDHTRSEKIAWEGTDLGLKLLQSTILRTVKCFDKNHIDKEYFEDADHDSTQFSS